LPCLWIVMLLTQKGDIRNAQTRHDKRNRSCLKGRIGISPNNVFVEVRKEICFNPSVMLDLTLWRCEFLFGWRRVVIN
jgi:hypothetical protein